MNADTRSNSPHSKLGLHKPLHQIAKMFGVSFTRKLVEKEARFTNAINAALASNRKMDAAELAAQRAIVRDELAVMLRQIEQEQNATSLAQQVKQSSPRLNAAKLSSVQSVAPIRVDVLA